MKRPNVWHLHVQRSWSQMFDPQRDTLIKWWPLGSEELLCASKAHLAYNLALLVSHMVICWPRCHGYSTLISMHMPSGWTGGPTAGLGLTHCQELPPPTHKQRKVCVNTNILWTQCKIDTSVYRHTSNSRTFTWMGIWRHTLLDRSQLYSVRLDAFSNSPTHKCIIWLF